MYGNLLFELSLPSEEFSRKPFILEFTLEFAELLLERSSGILISFSFKSINLKNSFFNVRSYITGPFYFIADFLLLFKTL